MQINFSEKDKLAELEFETLRETVNESNITGKPFNGLMHFSFIEKIMDIANAANLKPEINRIEAVNNNNKYAPGVSQIPGLADKHGENDHKSLLLRRVFADITMKSFETNEYIFSAAMIYHQGGVQIGLGPQVKACKNLCIMGAEHYVSTYGKNQVENLDHMFALIDEWFRRADTHFERGMNFLESLKNYDVNFEDFKRLVGALYMRKSLSDISRSFSSPFLKEAQIGSIIDKYNSVAYNPQENNYEKPVNLYDIYANATEFHRPSYTDMPNIIEGNVELNQIFEEEVENLIIDESN